MAIVRRGRTGDRVTSETRDGKNSKKFTQPWTVELESSDPPVVSGFEIMHAAGLPRPGRSIYSPRPGVIIPFAICRSVSPVASSASRRHWTVTATFELGGSGDEEPTPDDVDPADLTPRVEPFVESTELVIYEDFDGNSIVDPFQDLYEEPVKAPVALKGVNVTRYVPQYTEDLLAYWLHATNKQPWRGQPADAWCIQQVTGRTVEIGDFEVGQLQFKILSHPLELKVAIGEAAAVKRRVGWLAIRPLRSFTFLDDDDVEQINRRRGGGSPPRPLWIDTDGKPSDEPSFRGYRNRNQRNFSEIV